MSFVKRRAFSAADKQLVSTQAETVLNLGEPDVPVWVPKETKEDTHKPSKRIDLSSPVFAGVDMSKLTELSSIATSYKIDDRRAQYVENMTALLAHFDVETKKYSPDILRFASQVAEDYFSRRGSGEVKHEVVYEVCGPFFNNDEQLMDTMMDIVYPQVVKSSLFRRNRKRIVQFFFQLLRACSAAL